MPKSFESVPLGKKMEKQSVDEFNLGIGDVLVSETGTRRTIQEIVKDKEYPGGGYFAVERQDTAGNTSSGQLSFETFLKQQDALMAVERVAKEEPAPKPDAARELSAREKAALKQIERQLADTNTSEDDQAFLRKSREEMFAGEDDEDQTQTE